MVLDILHLRAKKDAKHHDSADPSVSNALAESLHKRQVFHKLHKIASECAKVDSKFRELSNELSSRRHRRSLVSTAIAKIKKPNQKAHPTKLPPTEAAVLELEKLSKLSVESLLDESKALKAAIAELEKELLDVSEMRSTYLSMLPNVLAQPAKYELVMENVDDRKLENVHPTSHSELLGAIFSESGLRIVAKAEGTESTLCLLRECRKKWLMDNDLPLTYLLCETDEAHIVTASSPDPDSSKQTYQTVLKNLVTLLSNTHAEAETVKLQEISPLALSPAGAFGHEIIMKIGENWNVVAQVEHTLDYHSRDISLRFGPKKMLQSAGALAHLIVGSITLKNLPEKNSNATNMFVVREEIQTQPLGSGKESIFERLTQARDVDEGFLIDLEQHLDNRSFINGFTKDDREIDIAMQLVDSVERQIVSIHSVQYPGIHRWLNVMGMNLDTK